MGIPVETDRLLLREFGKDDFDAVHAYATDVEVVRYMPWGPNGEADTREFLARAAASARAVPRAGYELAVVEKATSRLVGGVGLHRSEPASGTAMIGYCLARSAWGRGLATEAARAMLAFGFGELGLHRVWAGCDPDNAGSVRVLEKIGMRREGHLREDTWIRDEWRDTLVYGILAREWV